MPLTRAALYAAQAKKRATLDKEYTLSTVRAKRRRKGQDEYLCSWKDYGPDGDTWEPKEHLGEHFRKAASEAQISQVYTTVAVASGHVGYHL